MLKRRMLVCALESLPALATVKRTDMQSPMVTVSRKNEDEDLSPKAKA